jgi:hypothetical protein
MKRNNYKKITLLNEKGTKNYFQIPQLYRLYGLYKSRKTRNL